jgi:hypothetical protein
MVVGTGVAEQSYPITNRGLSIGRSEDRDVVIADPAASRHHCQIAAQGGEHVLRDMGSANGVFVNAVRVRECVLADGDLIRIGNTEMRFTRSGGAAAEPAPASRVPARAPNEPRAKPGPTVSPRDLPPSDQTMSRNQVPGRAPPRRSGGAGRIGAILGVVFGGSIVLVGGLAVALVAIGVVVYLVAQGSSGIQTYPPQPIRWELELEPGLDPAPVTTLFEEGRNKMRDRDHRGALQDFYRVLLADPGYRYVDKFAFAAGEYLVLDVLQKEFADGAAKRASDEAERDRLLTELRKGNRQAQLRAERQLKRNYAEDPVVVEALDLPESPMSVKLQKTSAEAMEQLNQNQFDEASRQFQSILESAKDPETRNQALASLKLCQKEVARASAEKWTQAVMAEASGDKDAAKRLFQEIKEEHPTNPSPAVHLDRLP